MKTLIKINKIFFVFLTLIIITFGSVFSVKASFSMTANEVEHNSALTEADKQWLYERFNDQHQQLIPVVAVADMFYGCYTSQKVEDNGALIFPDLIIKTDKSVLAEKLITCLGDESIKSDVALNYGLIGCFSQQFSMLIAEDKKQKMAIVKKSLQMLTKEERQKSFTKCVTEQAISFLR